MNETDQNQTEQRRGHGFQPIGNLAKLVSSSVAPSDSIKPSSSPSSLTTGLPRQDRRELKTIGTRHGEIGVAAKPIELLPEALKGADSDKTDSLLVASLPPSVNSTLKEIRVDINSDKYGWDSATAKYEIGECPPEDLRKSLALVERVMRPAEQSQIQRELARLRLTTKSRNQPDEDILLMVSVYEEYLAEYPEDVMRETCRAWARAETFWPSWAELKEIADRLVRRRAALERCLRLAVNG